LVSWRSPIEGTVAVNGYFDDIHEDCGGGVDWSIERGTLDTTVVVAKGTIKGPSSTFNERFSFNFSLPVEVGDEMYFVIDPGAESDACDTTYSDITIVGPIPTNN
jgi:hypothetical protein